MPPPIAPDTRTDPLLDTVIAAHGGRELWQRVRRIEAHLSSGGLAFAMHAQPSALKDLRIVVLPHERRVELLDYKRPGWRGLWTPRRVELRDADDRLVAGRDQPRRNFDRPIKNVWWDALDMLYFAGYALWNYLSFPFLLEDGGVEAHAEMGADGTRRLRARFPADMPTHSAEQVFHIDAAGHLRRHDYTADVIGTWAHAANLCQASTTVQGLRFYTRRRVYPRLGTGETVLPWPTLVWIELDDLAVHLGQPARRKDEPSR